MEVKKVKLLNKENSDRSLSIGSGCVIVQDNKILLVRGIGGNKFKFPGGHIYDTENFLESAEREVNEEIGCKVKAFGEPVFYIMELNEYRDIILIHYKADIIEGEPKPAAEIEEIKWVEINNIEIPVFDNVMNVIKEIYEKKGDI